MTEQDRLRTVTLFFYFSYLDEKLALASAQKTHRLLSANLGSQNEASDQTLVRLCMREWKRVMAKRQAKIQAAISFNAGWILPPDIDLGPWKTFVRTSDADEYLAVIWISILKLSEADVAQALSVTAGTLRHRVSRALRSLASSGLARYV